jgi:TRAP-type C4-dicarboxylate transport system permease small subunit
VDVQSARRGLEAVERRVQWVMTTLAGLVLIAMTLLIVYNIVARRFFNRPVEAVIDIVQAAMMVSLVYLALAAPAHIAIRLIMRRVPPTAAAAVNTLTWLLSAILFAVSAWAAFGRAESSRATGESTVGVTTFAIYPFRYLVAFGLFAAAVHVLVVGRSWVTGFEVEKIIEEAEEKALEAGELGE